MGLEMAFLKCESLGMSNVSSGGLRTSKEFL